MMELMTNNLANYRARLSHYAFGKRRLEGKCIVSVRDKEESRRRSRFTVSRSTRPAEASIALRRDTAVHVEVMVNIHSLPA